MEIFYYICTIMSRKKKKFSSFKNFKTQQRELQKEAGYFDGRFLPKVEKSKKDYSRKIKHKNNIQDE